MTDDMQEFVKKFNSSTDVVKAIETLNSQGYDLSGEPNALAISGECGVAGCSTTVLVVQVLRTWGANTRTQNVSALVHEAAPPGSVPLQVQIIPLVVA